MEKYNAIFEWNMSDQEIKAYKIACIWEDQVKKMFPDLKSSSKLPHRGDPRKCNLFRYSWKMMRETRGLLKQEEYKLFVIANLQILRANKGRVDPNALCGDKAWIRWIVWKKLFDQKSKEVAGQQTKPGEDCEVNPTVYKEILLTKKFLFEKCDGEPSQEKIKKFIEGPHMRIWVNSGKVSKYYLVLSPWVSQSIDLVTLEEKYHFDPSNFMERATHGIRTLFKNEFGHEYKNG